MIKRFRFTIVALVTVVVGLLVYQFWFNRPSEECKPVLDLLAFNTQQTEAIKAKTDDSAGLPPVAEDAAYGAWADGLSERAGKVTSPELATHAVELADLASQFAALLPVVRGQAHDRAPGAPAPPEAYQLSVLDTRITNELAELSKRCKR